MMNKGMNDNVTASNMMRCTKSNRKRSVRLMLKGKKLSSDDKEKNVFRNFEKSGQGGICDEESEDVSENVFEFFPKNSSDTLCIFLKQV